MQTMQTQIFAQQTNKLVSIRYLLTYQQLDKININKIVVMEVANEQEFIKSRLHAFDIEDRQYISAELMTTFNKSKCLPSKQYSFRQVSDWGDRYHIEDSHSLEPSKDRPIITKIEDQYEKLAFLMPTRNRKIVRQSNGTLPKKQKIGLAPISMKFVNMRSKNKLKRSTDGLARCSPERANMSFYQSNYEPLNLLYRLKTKKRSQQKANPLQQLPFIPPKSSGGEQKFPKTQRLSGIVRMMKRNQQIKEFNKRKRSRNQDIFQMPF